MNKGVIAVLVVILVGVGVGVVIKEDRKVAQLEQMMLGEVEQANQGELIDNQ